MFLTLLSGIGFEVADIIMDNLIKNIGGGNGGSASSFFSIHTLLGVSVAATVGMAATHTYKPSADSPSKDHQNIEERITTETKDLKQKIDFLYKKSIIEPKKYEDLFDQVKDIDNQLKQLKQLMSIIESEKYKYLSNRIEKIENNAQLIIEIKDKLNNIFRSVCNKYQPQLSNEDCQSFP